MIESIVGGVEHNREDKRGKGEFNNQDYTEKKCSLR